MDEVGGALIAIALVLCAVFIPAAFITGISGQFYRQFALTIAGATVISLIVSLTLVAGARRAAAQAARSSAHRGPGSGRCAASSAIFNRGFDALSHGYGWLAAPRRAFRGDHAAVVYAGIIAFGLNEFRKTPTGFIPAVDRAFLIIVTQLPPGAALARTDEVNRRAVEIALKTPGRLERGEHRRLLRRDLHQCAELRRDLRRARLVPEARPRSRAVGQRRSSRSSTAGSPASRRRRSSWLRRRRCRASAMPAASA